MGENDETVPSPESPPPGDGLVGRTLAGKYKVLAPIARGGMARIYKAEQLPLGRVVALKVLAKAQDPERDPNFQQRFFLEASTCAKLKHPNTVTVFDYGQNPDDGTFYIVMEFVDGRTLHDVIRAEGALAPARALRIAAEIARSLQEAHAHGVVHRDLKPSNVMLVPSDDGEIVKVLDFGVAKVLQSDRDNLTLDDRIVGSPRYMAPEQIRNGPIDARTDLYSLGIVLYEMLTGRPPFVHDHTLQILVAHLNDPVPPLSARAPAPVPPKVETLVLRCLAKEPADRPADVAAFRRQLKEVLGEIGDAPIVTREITDPSLRAIERVPTAGADSAPTLDRPREAARSVLPGALLGVLLITIGIVGFGGLALVAAVIGFRQSAAGPAPVAPPPAPEPVPVVAPAPPPAPAPLRLASEPAGAEVWEGDERLGVTPLTIELRPGDAPRTFELRHPGFRPATLTEAHAGGPIERTVTLERAPERPAPRPSPRPRPRPDDDIRVER